MEVKARIEDCDVVLTDVEGPERVGVLFDTFLIPLGVDCFLGAKGPAAMVEENPTLGQIVLLQLWNAKARAFYGQ